MIYVAPKETYLGLEMMIKALSGDTITFTRFKIGNGELEDGMDIKNLNDLVNPLQEITIATIERTDTAVSLTGEFDLSVITEDFRFREIGLFAKGSDGNEALYAYSNAGDSAGTLKANPDNVVASQKFGFVIAVGEAANIQAILNQSLVYVTQDEFKEHLNTKNPHKLTKDDVGLGNVANLAPNNLVWTYSVAKDNQELQSGEKASVALGKLARLVKSFIAHLSASNPHNIEPSDISAAAASHEHSASDIKKGVLSVVRGGTGRESIQSFAGDLKKFLSPVYGTFTGDGTQGRVIPLSFTPTCVLLMNSEGYAGCLHDTEYYGGIAYRTSDKTVNVTRNASSASLSVWDDKYTVLGIVDNGFKVNYYASGDIFSNTKDREYVYIAYR